MVFAAYLLENAILVLTLGRAFGPYFYGPLWEFCMKTQLHCGTFAAFPKQNGKMEKARQIPKGGGGGVQPWN